MRWGRGNEPTVKYVGRGMAILLAMRSVTASSSSAENRFPETIAKEKLFLACKVAILANAGCSWPLTSPSTMLCQSQSVHGSLSAGELCCSS